MDSRHRLFLYASEELIIEEEIAEEKRRNKNK